MANKFSSLWRSLKLRVTVFSLIIILVGIWSLAYLTSRMLRTDLQRLVGQQQFSTAAIVAADVNQEIDFRLRSLEKVAGEISPATLNDAAAVQDFLDSRILFSSLFNGGSFVVRADGIAMASIPLSANRHGIAYTDRDYIASALREGVTTVGKPVIGRALRTPVVSMATPIRDKQGRIIGALVGVVDLSKPNFLDRITDNRYGKTGGYLLVAAKQRLIITATDKSRIMQPAPAPGVNPLFDRYARGYEGSGAVVDTRGVEVLSSAKQIPAAGWFLVVRVPTKEAFVPIHKMQKSMVLAAIFLSFLAGGLTWLIVRRQLSPMLDAVRELSILSESDQPPTNLPIARKDEVGQLIGAFNRLLETLAHREAGLIESEEHHRSILRTAMDGIWLVDTEGRLREVNQAYCRMSGYSEQELLGRSISDLEAVGMADETANHIRNIVRQGEDRFESRHRRRDGSFFDVEVSVQYRSVKGGQLIAFIRDITGLRLAEDALRESESRLRYALEGTNDGLWDVQLKDGKTYLSPRGCEILGYREEEIEGAVEVWSDLVHPEDLQLTEERLQAHMEGRAAIFEVEQRLRTKSGDWKWIHTRGKVVERNLDGAPLRVTGTHSDITEKKILESQLHQAQKMESIGSLAGGVAHDFNNKLSVILGHTYLALAEPDPARRRDSLEEIRKAAEQSADLTRQLLAFARKQTIAPKVLDLNGTVNGMIKMLNRLIGEDISLTWQPAPDLWLLKVDPSQIDQILANLCVNARDSIADGGGITIETANCSIGEEYYSKHRDALPGEYVRLAVSDNGCGMDEKTLQRIFEPFFTTKETGKGTGLGLATVFGIVKQNSGFINVYSEPGLGTTFTVYLPRYLGNSGSSAADSMPMRAPRGLETILLVEDELAILNMTAMILTRQGYSVLQANSPAEAIQLANEYAGEIRLLITDVIMPEMNGRDLASTLTARAPELKCLFMSGYTADAISRHGVLDEGVSFIQKPFSLPGLASKVREALDGN